MKAGTYRTRIFVQAAILIAVLVFVNLVSLKIFARADLTANKAYSVSESTRKILKGLDDVVNIKVYFSRKLPPYMTALTRQVRDMLDEYRAYAGGSIVVDVQDPADDPETEQRVRTLGIPQVQLNVITKDKTEVMPGYLGIAILYGDKSEVLPVVQNTANLEYDLTSAILKVTRTEQKTVGFLAGGPTPSDAYEGVMKSLEQEYRVTQVSVSGGRTVPPEVSTLVVVGPEGATAWDRYAIDQFVMRGGQVLFLVNRIGIKEGTLEGVRVNTGLDSLLVHYGAEVKSDLVVDRSCGTASFSAGFFNFTVPYRLWPLVGPGGFDRASPITNQLERAVLPWASSIDLQPTAAGVEATVLAKSSNESWAESRLNLDPQRSFKPPAEGAAPRDLAVLLKGRFTSYFKDRPVPSATAADSAGATPPAPAASAGSSASPKIDASPETQMIVVGNARFIEDRFLGQYPENRIFFLNSVDWLTYGGDLIGIRSRAVSARPLKEIGEKSKATLRLASTLGVPFVVIAYGLVRRRVRASRRKRPILGTR
jgi:ABC-2 type transport system permease protein